jgi:cytochrome P450
MLSNLLPQLVADILRQPQFKGAAMFRYLGILNSERVIVTGKDALAELFQRYQYDFPKTDLLNLLASPIIGQGLVIVNGDEHKRQRRLLTPVFAMKHMRALEPIMWEKALESTELFTKIVTETATPSGFSQPINIDHYTGLVGLDIISKAALGVDYQSMKDPDSDLVRNYREVFEPTLVFRWLSLSRLLIPLEWIKKLPLKRVQGGLKAIELLHASFHKEIDKKKALMEKGELKTNDIISLLIRDRHCVDDDELVTHMLTMLGAGHETVAVSITWAVYEFARNPEWQKSIRAEVRQVLRNPRPDAPPEYADFEADKMPLLNAFVSEVLRYWPAIPFSSRTAAKDCTLQGVFIPATTKISWSIVAINRDEDNFGPDAATFNPSRWLRKDDNTGAMIYDANGGALHKLANMTFLHGQRACIGRVFARQKMLNLLACWVARFDWVLTDVAQMDEEKVAISGGGLTSRPQNGMYVNARRVDGW